MNALDPKITVSELMVLDYEYKYTDAELWTDWARLKSVREFKTGSQFQPGIKLCQHFFPNFWDISNEKGENFRTAWMNPVLMSEVLDWGRRSMSQLWLSWIRRAVYMRAGLPNSSFYRPHFSKQICQMTDKKYGVLFDPCAGWGGRLLGTVANGWHYIGCEPNLQTYNNLKRMVEFLEVQDQVTLFNLPAEDYIPDPSTFTDYDVVLTSPPYFNLEVYTADSAQSYNKHSTYADWSENWFKPLMRSCLQRLTPGGLSCWNVMNFKKNDLVADVFHVHENLTLDATVGFRSPLGNLRNIKNKDVTYVFRS